MIWGVILMMTMLISGVFSGGEIAWLSASSLEWIHWRRKYPWRWRLVQFFLRAPRRLLITILIGSNLALITFGWTMSHLVAALTGLPSDKRLWIETLFGAAILFVSGEYMPKIVGYRLHKALLPHLVPLLGLSYAILWPLVEPLYRLIEGAFRLLKIPAAQAEKLTGRAALLTAFSQNAEPEFRDILAKALHLSETPVREIMVPRREIAMIDIHTPAAQAVEFLKKTGFSRLLIYEEHPDQVRGYVYIRSLLQAPKHLREVVQAVVAVPESMPASKLLELMVREKRSLAIVVDARGGLAGLVTTEDLVEEVFGEIHDEHDQMPLELREEAPGTYIVDGRWEIDALNEALGLELPAQGAVTIAGLVVDALGHIPKSGESWKAYGLHWTVLKATRQRIQTVKIIRL